MEIDLAAAESAPSTAMPVAGSTASSAGAAARSRPSTTRSGNRGSAVAGGGAKAIPPRKRLTMDEKAALSVNVSPIISEASSLIVTPSGAIVSPTAPLAAVLQLHRARLAALIVAQCAGWQAHATLSDVGLTRQLLGAVADPTLLPSIVGRAVASLPDAVAGRKLQGWVADLRAASTTELAAIDTRSGGVPTMFGLQSVRAAECAGETVNAHAIDQLRRSLVPDPGCCGSCFDTAAHLVSHTARIDMVRDVLANAHAVGEEPAAAIPPIPPHEALMRSADEAAMHAVQTAGLHHAAEGERAAAAITYRYLADEAQRLKEDAIYVATMVDMALRAYNEELAAATAATRPSAGRTSAPPPSTSSASIVMQAAALQAARRRVRGTCGAVCEYVLVLLDRMGVLTDRTGHAQAGLLALRGLAAASPTHILLSLEATSPALSLPAWAMSAASSMTGRPATVGAAGTDSSDTVREIIACVALAESRLQAAAVAAASAAALPPPAATAATAEMPAVVGGKRKRGRAAGTDEASTPAAAASAAPTAVASSVFALESASTPRLAEALASAARQEATLAIGGGDLPTLARILNDADAIPLFAVPLAGGSCSDEPAVVSDQGGGAAAARWHELLCHLTPPAAAGPPLTPLEWGATDAARALLRLAAWAEATAADLALFGIAAAFAERVVGLLQTALHGDTMIMHHAVDTAMRRGKVGEVTRLLASARQFAATPAMNGGCASAPPDLLRRLQTAWAIATSRGLAPDLQLALRADIAGAMLLAPPPATAAALEIVMAADVAGSGGAGGATCGGVPGTGRHCAGPGGSASIGPATPGRLGVAALDPRIPTAASPVWRSPLLARRAADLAVAAEEGGFAGAMPWQQPARAAALAAAYGSDGSYRNDELLPLPVTPFALAQAACLGLPTTHLQAGTLTTALLTLSPAARAAVLAIFAHLALPVTTGATFRRAIMLQAVEEHVGSGLTPLTIAAFMRSRIPEAAMRDIAHSAPAASRSHARGAGRPPAAATSAAASSAERAGGSGVASSILARLRGDAAVPAAPTDSYEQSVAAVVRARTSENVGLGPSLAVGAPQPQFVATVAALELALTERAAHDYAAAAIAGKPAHFTTLDAVIDASCGGEGRSDAAGVPVPLPLPAPSLLSLLPDGVGSSIIAPCGLAYTLQQVNDAATIAAYAAAFGAAISATQHGINSLTLSPMLMGVPALHAPGHSLPPITSPAAVREAVASAGSEQQVLALLAREDRHALRFLGGVNPPPYRADAGAPLDAAFAHPSVDDAVARLLLVAPHLRLRITADDADTIATFVGALGKPSAASTGFAPSGAPASWAAGDITSLAELAVARGVRPLASWTSERAFSRAWRAGSDGSAVATASADASGVVRDGDDGRTRRFIDQPPLPPSTLLVHPAGSYGLGGTHSLSDSAAARRINTARGDGGSGASDGVDVVRAAAAAALAIATPEAAGMPPSSLTETRGSGCSGGGGGLRRLAGAWRHSLGITALPTPLQGSLAPPRCYSAISIASPMRGRAGGPDVAALLRGIAMYVAAADAAGLPPHGIALPLDVGMWAEMAPHLLVVEAVGVMTVSRAGGTIAAAANPFVRPPPYRGRPAMLTATGTTAADTAPLLVYWPHRLAQALRHIDAACSPPAPATAGIMQWQSEVHQVLALMEGASAAAMIVHDGEASPLPSIVCAATYNMLCRSAAVRSAMHAQMTELWLSLSMLRPVLLGRVPLSTVSTATKASLVAAWSPPLRRRQDLSVCDAPPQTGALLMPQRLPGFARAAAALHVADALGGLGAAVGWGGYHPLSSPYCGALLQAMLGQMARVSAVQRDRDCVEVEGDGGGDSHEGAEALLAVHDARLPTRIQVQTVIAATLGLSPSSTIAEREANALLVMALDVRSCVAPYAARFLLPQAGVADRLHRANFHRTATALAQPHLEALLACKGDGGRCDVAMAASWLSEWRHMPTRQCFMPQHLSPSGIPLTDAADDAVASPDWARWVRLMAAARPSSVVSRPADVEGTAACAMVDDPDSAADNHELGGGDDEGGEIRRRRRPPRGAAARAELARLEQAARDARLVKELVRQGTTSESEGGSLDSETRASSDGDDESDSGGSVDDDRATDSLDGEGGAGAGMRTSPAGDSSATSREEGAAAELDAIWDAGLDSRPAMTPFPDPLTLGDVVEALLAEAAGRRRGAAMDAVAAPAHKRRPAACEAGKEAAAGAGAGTGKVRRGRGGKEPTRLVATMQEALDLGFKPLANAGAARDGKIDGSGIEKPADRTARRDASGALVKVWVGSNWTQAYDYPCPHCDYKGNAVSNLEWHHGTHYTNILQSYYCGCGHGAWKRHSVEIHQRCRNCSRDRREAAVIYELPFIRAALRGRRDDLGADRRPIRLSKTAAREAAEEEL